MTAPRIRSGRGKDTASAFYRHISLKIDSAFQAYAPPAFAHEMVVKTSKPE
ncbi:hypothetical protein [Rhizobium rhizogenes]|uniref:hypothetical protein n=1 Tax=Rhizobium rhizogenes TaxID=359 RepID=UPI000A9BD48A|nr:hypothetical protein [Rhizobium rhizogenes]